MGIAEIRIPAYGGQVQERHGSEGGLVAWATSAPLREAGEAEPVAGDASDGGPGRRLSKRSKWLIGGGAMAVVAIVALVLALSGVFSSTALTPIGQSVHVTQTDDYIHRSADITLNSVKVTSDDSLCETSTSNTLGYWVVIDITVTNTGSENIPMNPGGFDITDSDGNSAKLPDGFSDDCFPADNGLGQMIHPGDTVEVQLAKDSNIAAGTLSYEPVIQDRPVSWSFPTQ